MKKLTHEKIRREALKLIDAGGLEAFSTRKLGLALRCEAMALYWYYPNKEAILDAVVDELMSRIGRAEPTTDSVAALRDVARAYRGLAHRHPNAFPLVATRRFATPGTYAFLERLFELAQRDGVDDRTTARFFRAVASYCSGIALNEIAARRDDDDPEVRAQFGRLAAVSKWLGPEHADDLFEFGLDVLVGAFASARHPQRGRAKPARVAPSARTRARRQP